MGASRSKDCASGLSTDRVYPCTKQMVQKKRQLVVCDEAREGR